MFLSPSNTKTFPAWATPGVTLSKTVISASFILALPIIKEVPAFMKVSEVIDELVSNFPSVSMVNPVFPNPPPTVILLNAVVPVISR